MNYLYNKYLINLLSLVVISLNVLTIPLNAVDPLWDAIEAYEANDLKKAARLFEPYLRGHPIARPYCRDLSERGLLKDDFPHENFVGFKQSVIANAWFETSCILNKASQIKSSLEKQAKKVAKMSEKKARKVLQPFVRELSETYDQLKKLQTPAATFALGNLFASKVLESADPEKFSHFCYKRSLTTPDSKPSGFFDSDNGCLDLRSFFLIAKSKIIAEIKFGDILILDLIKDMEKSFETQKMCDVLYGVSQRFDGKPECDLFLRTAAYYGSIDAQMGMAKQSKSEQELLYWLAQAAEQGEVVACDNMAYNYEHGNGVRQDWDRSIYYSKRAVEFDKEKTLSFKQNLTKRLTTLKRFGELITIYKGELEKGPNDDVQNEYGFCLVQLNRRDEATEAFRGPAFRGHVTAINNFVSDDPDQSELLALMPIALEAGKTDENIVNILQILLLKCDPLTQEKYKQSVFDLLLKHSKSDDVEIKRKALHDMGFFLVYSNSDGRLIGNPAECFSEAIQLGCLESDYELGVCYERGFGIEPDPKQALLHFEKAIEHGSLVALNSAAKHLMDLKSADLDKKAVGYLKKSYKEFPINRTVVAYNLGIMHKEGRGGLNKDPVLIEKYFMEASEDKELRIDAQQNLATYLIIKDINNFDKAKALLSEGVEKKDPESLSLMGQCYLIHPKSDENRELREKAVLHIFEAAKLGYSTARAIFAYLTSLGVEGVLKQDSDKVNKYLSQFSKEEVTLFEELHETHIYKKRKLAKEVMQVQEVQPAEETILEEEESTGSDIEPFDEQEIAQEMDLPLEVEVTERVQDPRVAKLQTEVENMKGLKQVKWRKMRSLMGKMIKCTTGSFKPGKGSGHCVDIGGQKKSLHIPHGSNPMLKGGALESLTSQMDSALEKTNKDELKK